MIKSLRKRRDHLSRLLDNAYEDKLCGKISEELWIRKSKEWQSELDEANLRLSACDSATGNYYEMGARILELANAAYGLYLKQTAEEKAKLLRELLSNSTFTRGTLCPTYNKPFDILAEGARFQSKRALRDEFRNWEAGVIGATNRMQVLATILSRRQVRTFSPVSGV